MLYLLPFVNFSHGNLNDTKIRSFILLGHPVSKEFREKKASRFLNVIHNAGRKAYREYFFPFKLLLC